MIIKAIIFQNGNDDYELCSDFNLTKEEERKIMDILRNHETEGCSVRGTKKDIIKETKYL